MASNHVWLCHCDNRVCKTRSGTLSDISAISMLWYWGVISQSLHLYYIIKHCFAGKNIFFSIFVYNLQLIELESNLKISPLIIFLTRHKSWFQTEPEPMLIDWHSKCFNPGAWKSRCLYTRICGKSQHSAYKSCNALILFKQHKKKNLWDEIFSWTRWNWTLQLLLECWNCTLVQCPFTTPQWPRTPVWSLLNKGIHGHTCTASIRNKNC